MYDVVGQMNWIVIKPMFNLCLHCIFKLPPLQGHAVAVNTPCICQTQKEDLLRAEALLLLILFDGIETSPLHISQRLQSVYYQRKEKKENKKGSICACSCVWHPFIFDFSEQLWLLLLGGNNLWDENIGTNFWLVYFM